MRRAGELLKQIEPQRGGDRKSIEYQSTGSDTLISRKAAAEQAGMSKRQAETAQRIASIPEQDFEKQVEPGQGARDGKRVDGADSPLHGRN